MNELYCLACNGTNLEWLGNLGIRAWFKRKNCGMLQSTKNKGE